MSTPLNEHGRRSARETTTDGRDGGRTIASAVPNTKHVLPLGAAPYRDTDPGPEEIARIVERIIARFRAAEGLEIETDTEDDRQPGRRWCPCHDTPWVCARCALESEAYRDDALRARTEDGTVCPDCGLALSPLAQLQCGTCAR